MNTKDQAMERKETRLPEIIFGERLTALKQSHERLGTEIAYLEAMLANHPALRDAAPVTATETPGQMLRIICGPTCGCGKTFEAVMGQDATCPHCGQGQGRVPVVGGYRGGVVVPRAEWIGASQRQPASPEARTA